MLNWVKRNWIPFTLVAIWLVFECIVSWLATCQPLDDSTTSDHYYPERCTAFSGPVFSILNFCLARTGLFLKGYEHELIAGFTIVLAISTIGLWVSTIKLWKAGEKQIKASRSTAAVQARNMRRQLSHAEFSVERQLRAYVFIKDFICSTIGDKTYGPKFVALRVVPVWKNSGQTPTRRMVYHISWKVFDREFRDDEDFVDLNSLGNPDIEGTQTYPLVIAPGETVKAAELLIWREELERMDYVDDKITARTYIWGWAEYDDVFKDTQAAELNFVLLCKLAAT
jgi:hypothetical protein